MLDQTTVKKARRAISRKLQLALETKVELLKAHLDKVSDDVAAAELEPEDLAKKFLEGGVRLWNPNALREISDLQGALDTFDGVIRKIESAESGCFIVKEIYYRDEGHTCGPDGTEQGAKLPPENFVGLARLIYDTLAAAGLNPAFRAFNASRADLVISW